MDSDIIIVKSNKPQRIVYGVDKQKIIIIVLAVALFLAIQYLILDRWTNSALYQISESYKHGYDKGLEDAVTAIYYQTKNCQKSTIVLGNMTKEVFDFACLQQNLSSSVP